MKRFYKLTAWVITLAMIIALFPLSAVAENTEEVSSVYEKMIESVTSENGYGLTRELDASRILYAWNWSFENIKEKMQDIAEQGFGGVLVSPPNEIKMPTKDVKVCEPEVEGISPNGWWMLYEPAGFQINESEDSALGTKDDFEGMCEEAGRYGIKIMVEAVVGYMGSDDDHIGEYDNTSENVMDHVNPRASEFEPELIAAQAFHTPFVNSGFKDSYNDGWSNYDIEESLTQHAISGRPDLDTSAQTVQDAIYDYLVELVEAGADGFYFNDARHIETSSDTYFPSDFWDDTLSKVRENYPDVENYAIGEVFGTFGDGRSTSEYTGYMDVTNYENYLSLKDAVTGIDAADLEFSFAPQDNTVLWTETGRTYAGGETSALSAVQINKIWALAAARQGVTSLYMARPDDTTAEDKAEIEDILKGYELGAAYDTAWSNDEVKAVNQFANFFKDEDENAYYTDGIVVIERGYNGAVVVDTMGENADISLEVENLEDGTYTDSISGNEFTISDGVLSGQIGETEIAVLYRSDVVEDTIMIADITLKSGEYLVNGESEPSVSVPADDGYAYYEDGVLTLVDFSYEGFGYTYDNDIMSETVIYSENPLTIFLTGYNSIGNLCDSGGETCIHAKELTIKGTGSLVLDAMDPIYAENDIHITGGKLDVNVRSYYGIRSGEGNVEITGGEVKVDGGNIGLASDYGKVIIEDGVIEIDAYQYVIRSGEDFEIDEGGLILPTDYDVAWADGNIMVSADNSDFITYLFFANNECEWSEELTYNAGYHWHPCTDDECVINAFPELCDGYEEHNTDGVCTCGYDTTREVKVYIGSLGIAEGEYLDNDGELHTEKPRGGYAHYKNGVLTLNNFEFAGESYTNVICEMGTPDYEDDDVLAEAVLCATEDIKLVLKGESYISNTTDGDGIFSNHDITVSGDGKLEIEPEDDGIDIWGEFVMESGELDIKAYNDIGITVKKDVFIKGGKMDIYADDDGILSRGSIYVSDGDINIVTEEKGFMTMPYYDSDGEAILFGGDIKISGGTINIIADDEAIYTDEISDDDTEVIVGDIIISGGDITLFSEEDCINANNKIDYDGEYVSGGNIEISGGTLKLDAEESGIEAENNTKITGGNIEIKADLFEEGHPAFNVSGELTLGEKVEISKPKNAKISTEVYELYEKEVQTIVDRNGMIATEVEIKTKKSDTGGIGIGGNGIGGSLGGGSGSGFTGSGSYTPSVAAPNAKVFNDVHPLNHWAKADIDYVCKKNLMNGVSDEMFDPDGEVTRAMLITVLYRHEGEPATNRSIPFADVDMSAYYANAVIWGQQNGIINGYSEIEFAPDDNITREQISAIMFRYAVYKGMNALKMEENLHFDDSDMISEYAVSAMNWAVESGLMTGKSETTINPQDFATRAEIAAILHRYIEAN